MPRHPKSTKKTRKTHVRRKTLFKRKGQFKMGANRERINYMIGNQMPYAPRYRCKMTMSFMCIIQAGDLTIDGKGQAYIGLNYLYLPINNASWNISGPFTLNSTVSAISMQPTGLTQLMPPSGQFYRNYRVYASKVVIQGAPETPADYLEITLTPSTATTLPADTSVALAQPYTKAKPFWTGKAANNSADLLKNYMTVHRLAGVTSQAIQNDLSGNFIGRYDGTYPVTQYHWVINVQKLDGFDNISNVDFIFKLTYWVEFFNPSSGAFPIS